MIDDHQQIRTRYLSPTGDGYTAFRTGVYKQIPPDRRLDRIAFHTNSDGQCAGVAKYIRHEREEVHLFPAPVGIRGPGICDL